VRNCSVSTIQRDMRVGLPRIRRKQNDGEKRRGRGRRLDPL
jgi:hypothetical protein